MGRFFTRERFGRPQVLAALLLFAFLAQCLWLVDRGGRSGIDPEEIYRLERGTALWKHRGIGATGYMLAAPVGPETELEDSVQPCAPEPWLRFQSFDLWYLIASRRWCCVRCSCSPKISANCTGWQRLLPRFRSAAGGFALVRLAAAVRQRRRLCGPPLCTASRRESCGRVPLYSAEPEVGAAWGAFGAIFTAIAVAHTLYAPREVVLWNWRRIVLLGLSLALAVGSQFSLVVVVPLALGFMLYLAPTRRMAAVAIWLSHARLLSHPLYVLLLPCGRSSRRALSHASFFGLS